MENRTKDSPSLHPLPEGEGEPLDSSVRAECAWACGRAGVGRAALPPNVDVGDRSQRPRMLTKRSHVLPLPGGEGGVRGKVLFDSYRVPYPSSPFYSIDNGEEP